MTHQVSRRTIVGGLAAAASLSAFAGIRVSFAQNGATLEQLRSQQLIRVGLVNEPPYSGLNPDGTISGFVPTLVTRVMNKLGVPAVEGIAASYGELIPGLQAGRWDMIAASFRLTKERCSQILFTDPVTFDGGAIAYVKESLSEPPRSLKELADADLQIGVLQGTYLIQRLADLGVTEDRISQYPSNPALIDGLVAGRMPVALSTNASLKRLLEQRPETYEIVYPLPEDPPVGSGPAFRQDSAELHAAFNEELRRMRDSGELYELAAEFGFDPPPEELRMMSGEEICASFG